MCVSLGSTKATNRKSFRHHLVITHRMDLIRTRRGGRWFDVLRQLSGAELQRRAAAVDKRSMSASRRRELGISTPRPSDGRRGMAAAGFAHCPKSSSGNDRPVTSSVSVAPRECEQPPDYLSGLRYQHVLGPGLRLKGGHHHMSTTGAKLILGRPSPRKSRWSQPYPRIRLGRRS
jgi:hypothetical protein